jgi:UDP-3-O-acyl-N-acetylglucosamine deacetylase
MGFILLHLAALLNPRKQPLRHRLRLVRHLALLASFGYLLLIPLQLASSFRAFTAVHVERNQKGSQLTQLMEKRELIINSKSNQDLSLHLKSLKESGLSPAQKTKDFANLQRDLISENQSRQALLAPNSYDSKQLSVLTLMISRVGSALTWAVAFAAGAVPWGSRRTLLERLSRRPRDEA